MTSLHERFGEMPYQYVLDSPLNDYQVTIEGPSGRAIVTEVYDGEDYEIATMFYGQSVRNYTVREWCGSSSPDMALNRLVQLNSTHLANRGIEIPPLYDPRHKYYAAAIVTVAVVLIAAALLFAFTGSGSDGRPSAPITYSPAQTLEGPR